MYALCQINFAFDRDKTPYMQPDEIVGFFGSCKATLGQKAKTIRNTMRLRYFDREFSTAEGRC